MFGCVSVQLDDLAVVRKTSAVRDTSEIVLTENAAVFFRSSMAENTVAAYATDWASFSSWCEGMDVSAMPADPATVANFLANQAQRYAPSTVGRRLAAINKAHQLRGHTPPGRHPAVSAVLDGIRRATGRPPRRMQPLLADGLQQTIEAMAFSQARAGGVADRRDACLLVFGFAGAFRRSELAGLTLGDVLWHPSDGLHVTLKRSKTDQTGLGQRKALPFGRHPRTCPVCVLNRWLDVLTQPRHGADDSLPPIEAHVCRDPHPALSASPRQWLFPPIGRSGTVAADRHVTGQAVNEIVRRRLAAAGIGPEGYGSHSMRAGFVTQALRNGATDAQVMRQTGHRSPTTVHIYDRENNPLRGNAVTKIGL